MDLNWWTKNIPGYRREFHAKKESKRKDLSFIERRALINEISVINHITSDDPPTFMRYGMNPDDPIPGNLKRARGWIIHHVNFGIAMEEKLKLKGVNVNLNYPKANKRFKDEISFLIHQLKK